MTVRHLFTHYLDLRARLRRPLLHLLEHWCGDSAERAQIQRALASHEQFAQMVSERPSLIALLQQFESCQPPLARLLECLGQLKDRSFSVASAPLGWCKTVDLVFGVEREVLPSGVLLLCLHQGRSGPGHMLADKKCFIVHPLAPSGCSLAHHAINCPPPRPTPKQTDSRHLLAINCPTLVEPRPHSRSIFGNIIETRCISS